MTHEGLRRWYDFTSHEVVKKFDRSFLASTKNKLTIFWDLEINALHICHTVRIFDVNKFLLLSKSVEFQFAWGCQYNEVFSVGCKSNLLNDVTSKIEVVPQAEISRLPDCNRIRICADVRK